jgi:hypothetical protein
MGLRVAYIQKITVLPYDSMNQDITWFSTNTTASGLSSRARMDFTAFTKIEIGFKDRGKAKAVFLLRRCIGRRSGAWARTWSCSLRGIVWTSIGIWWSRHHGYHPIRSRRRWHVCSWMVWFCTFWLLFLRMVSCIYYSRFRFFYTAWSHTRVRMSVVGFQRYSINLWWGVSYI